MSFPADLTATLSGTSVHQLYLWRKSGLLIPEVNAGRPPLYSFRDVTALRAMAFLRARTSLQSIRTAFGALRPLNFNDHPSAYRFETDGRTIAVTDASGNSVDLVRYKGQMAAFTLADIFRPFENLQNQTVADFEHPRPRLAVNGERLGGWPTIEGTRVPYDVVTQFLGEQPADEDFDDLQYYYPNVSREAAEDAVDFQVEVSAVNRGSAA
ncbi:DUF433 domain-containing protein [Paenarthrobacter sp. TYUT067]|uniref:DUF433 domain-containing protein n=1 Tax=Paenarthrobacter sp. TYUT067 TaxID=2926245 RepID=UPI002030C9BC|nr:DUF433 domain-containing protein [Paenarthrobacter sp. TYUT067]MCM0614470.1 DUF433 domain-containing protein [Paenarthrobacter sp. TYUT067]